MDQNRDEVRILTVHASKGLEAPIVFLVDSGSASVIDQHMPRLTPFRLQGEFRGLQGYLWRSAAEVRNSYSDGLLVDLKDRADDEYRRLLYVGMTRAEDRLIICGYHGVRAQGPRTWHSIVARALSTAAESETRPHPAAEDIVHPRTGEVLAARNTLLDEELCRNIDRAGVDSVHVRSVLTCDTKTGVCGRCYGRDLARGTTVNIGEAVGVIAAQSIGEPGTQLTMRTFHIGGAAQSSAEQAAVESPCVGVVRLVNPRVVRDSSERQVILGRNTELVVYDEVGREKLRQKLPNGTRLRADPDSAVEKGQVLAEWDPHTLPVITEASGTIVFQDLIDGTSFREVIDEATGKASKEVIDWRQNARSGNLRPSIVLQDEHGNPITLPSGSEARYYLPVGAIMSVENGLKVLAGDILARLPREASKTRDITGGLPRVAELFEARSPKDKGTLAEITGTISFGKETKGKVRLQITDPDGKVYEELVPKEKNILVHEGQVVNKGELIVDGAALLSEGCWRGRGVAERTAPTLTPGAGAARALTPNARGGGPGWVRPSSSPSGPAVRSHRRQRCPLRRCRRRVRGRPQRHGCARGVRQGGAPLRGCAARPARGHHRVAGAEPPVPLGAADRSGVAARLCPQDPPPRRAGEPGHQPAAEPHHGRASRADRARSDACRSGGPDPCCGRCRWYWA